MGGGEFVAGWIAITPKVPRPLILQDNFIKKEMEKVMRPAQKDFQEFVAPFRAKNRPTIKIKVTKKRNSYMSFAGVETNWSKGKKADKNAKFMFLVRGTSERRATMSSEFRAKSKRGSIKSRGARGNRDPVAYGTKRPGIESRDTEKVVRKKRERQIKFGMKVLFKKALIRSKLSFF